MNRVQRNLSIGNKELGKENFKKKRVKISFKELEAKRKSIKELVGNPEEHKGYYSLKNETIQLLHNYKFFPCSRPLKQKSFNYRKDNRPLSVMPKSPKKVNGNNIKVWSVFDSGFKNPSPANRSKTICKNTSNTRYIFNRIKSDIQDMSQSPDILSSFLIKSAEFSSKDMKKNKILPKIQFDSPFINNIEENESNDEDSPYKYDALYLKPKFNSRK